MLKYCKSNLEVGGKMELRVLNYFLMAAREENITKAANLLHVTQPTLSRQLKQLEDELGVKLFDRSSHNIILTEDGMLLKRRAQELILLAEKTKKEFQNEEILTGEIAIGCGELNGMSVLAEIINQFRQKHSQIRFDIYSGNADGIKERLEHGLLDFSLLQEPVDIRKYEFIRMPIKDEWGVLLRNDHPLTEKSCILAEDLIGVPLILPKRSMIQNELLSWFGEHADSIDMVATYNLLYNSAIMVQNGIGSAICLNLEAKYNNLSFVPISPKLEMSSLLAWKNNQIFTPAVSAFIDFTKRYMLNKKSEEIDMS